MMLETGGAGIRFTAINGVGARPVAARIHVSGAITRRFGASTAPRRTGVKRVGAFIPFPSYALRCKSGIQSRANEDQDGRGQEDDSIVVTQTEGARAAGKHESAQGIDDVGQGI